MKKVTVNRYNLKNQMEKTEFNQDCGRNHMNRSYSIEMLAHPIAKLRERIALGKIFIELKGGLK